MTEAQLAVLLRALASEAKLLRELLCLCAASGLLPASMSRPLVERAISDLQGVASRAEALAEFVVLSYAGSKGR